jgi:colicin import membrane protein
MPAATDRLEFGPPPQPGLVRAFALAVLAHILLMIALTWGIRWNKEAEREVAEAELWSSVPQQAAPRLVEAPPPPPVPEVKAPPPPPPPVVQTPKQPDIALEQEKKKRELERRREEQELQKKLEAKRKQDELKREQLAEKKAAEQRKKQEDQAKSKKQQQEDSKRVEALRQENLKRMQGLAGATGAAESKGTAQRSAGPSDSYAGRIQARVRPNIVFTDDVPGNPTTDVEVQMAPDGTITGRRVVKSSGVRSWDEAVLRALDKTEILPRDIDGRVHSPLIIEFRPRR